MKIKAILIVFFLIIISGSIFTILSSRTSTQNNKNYIAESFAKAISDHKIPVINVKNEFVKKGNPQNDQHALAQIDTVRAHISNTKEQFVATRYDDLPETEKTMITGSNATDNIFVIKQHGKKILSIQIIENKIASFAAPGKSGKEMLTPNGIISN